MKTVEFIIAGEPHGKGRPRVVSRNGFTKAYTPQETASYENLVRVEYELQTRRYKFSNGSFIEMVIEAYYSIPKSVSKKRRAMMLSGELRPTKKPDMDNVVKIIADSLNNIAYKDDTQIVTCKCYKYYSDDPCVKVTLKELGVDPTKE